jgi:hypothetical protein
VPLDPWLPKAAGLEQELVQTMATFKLSADA